MGIYLDGIGKLARRNVLCQVERKSLDIRIRDLNGKNYRLYEPELWGECNPERVHLKYKPNKLVLIIKKGGMETRKWPKLGFSG